MVFGTFRIYGSKARACVLLFEAFGSSVLGLDFATVLQRVLLFEAFGLVFCCSRLSEALFPRPDFARPKRVFLWIPKVT